MKNVSIRKLTSDGNLIGYAILEIIEKNGTQEKDYIFKECNNLFAELINESKTQIVGKSIFDLLPSIGEFINNIKISIAEPRTFEVSINSKEKYYEIVLQKISENCINVILKDVTNNIRKIKEHYQNELLYKNLFDLNLDGLAVFEFNYDGKISSFLEVNDAFVQITGYTKEELLKMNISDLQNYFSTDRSKEAIREIDEKGIASSEEKIRNKNGTEIFIEVKAIPISYKSRPAILNIIRDITKQKESQLALKRSEAQFRFMVESIQIGAVYVEGENLFFNKAAENIIGYKNEEIKTVNNWFHLLYKERANEVIERYENNKKNGFPVANIVEATVKNGAKRNLQFFSYAKDDKGVWIFNDVTDTILAERKLQESQVLLSNLLDNIPGAVFAHNFIGDFIFVNKKASNFLGISQEDLTHKKIEDCFKYFEFNFDLDTLFERLRNEKSFNFESSFKTKDGLTYQTMFHYSTFRFKNEDIILGIAFNLTEQKKKELELRESQERFRIAFENANIGAAIISIDEKYIKVNDRFSEMLGYSLEELENQCVNNYTYPDDVGNSHDFVTKAINGEVTKTISEKRYIHKNGKIVWGLLSCSMVRDSDNNPLYFLSYIQDISHIKELEENLKDTNNRLNSILEDSLKKEKEITELLNATHSILKSNDFEAIAKEIFNSLKESIGANSGFIVLLNEDNNDNEVLFIDSGDNQFNKAHACPFPITGFLKEAYKSGQIIYENDFINSEWYKYLPKTHIPIPNILVAPLNIDSKIVGIIGISKNDCNFNENDVRIASAFAEYASIALDKRRYYENLQKYANELKETNLLKDKFFSVVAHDLRAPFSGFLGLSELLATEPESLSIKQLKDMGEAIHNSANAIYDLLNELLQWSRLQMGSIPFELEENDLYEIIINNVYLLNKTAEIKKIKISTLIEKNTKVKCDKNMIMTVIRNLIDNAIKFSNPNGNIYITCEKTEYQSNCYKKSLRGNYYKISVIDEGTGISEEKIQEILTLEKKTSTPGTNGEKGTGLGLVLCKEFIDKHNGKLWIESEKGVGSKFIFTLESA
ncbi:MAG TPA: PAS domain S-box protein [Candidatus Kapabacteria bacterium]|nr:PAS domain S-box protein [Candidatus Kapabacteria bacterium]